MTETNSLNKFLTGLSGFFVTIFFRTLWFVLIVSGYCLMVLAIIRLWEFGFLPKIFALVLDSNFHFSQTRVDMWVWFALFVEGWLLGVRAKVPFNKAVFLDELTNQRKFEVFFKEVLDLIKGLLVGFFGAVSVLGIYFLIAVAVAKLWKFGFIPYVYALLFMKGFHLSQTPLEMWLWFSFLVLVFIMLIHLIQKYKRDAQIKSENNKSPY